jgi:lipopolysaccharide heptosyltransferase II
MLKRFVRRSYRALLGTVCRVIGALSRVRRPGAGPLDRAAVRRVLVLRFGLLGDAALLTPALGLIRDAFPAAEVHVLATPGQVPLFEPLPWVDQVLVWAAGDLTEPRQALSAAAWRQAASVVRALRRTRYDVALSCYGPLASAVALLSGTRFRFGFAAEALPGTLTNTLPGGRYDRPWHEARYNVALAQAAGAHQWRGGGPAPPMRLVVDAAARAALDARLDAYLAGRSPGRLVVLHPGATNGAAKRWPPAHWVELASRLGADGAVVVLAGGPQDRVLTRTIAGRSTPRPIDLGGATSLPELLALLALADVFVSGDSGPVHFAVGLGRPVVGIYGPTDPAVYGPYDRRHAVVVRQPLPCSPCYRPTTGRVADCPLGHTLCQRLIAPDTVYAAICSLLPPLVTPTPDDRTVAGQAGGPPAGNRSSGESQPGER